MDKLLRMHLLEELRAAIFCAEFNSIDSRIARVVQTNSVRCRNQQRVMLFKGVLYTADHQGAYPRPINKCIPELEGEILQLVQEKDELAGAVEKVDSYLSSVLGVGDTKYIKDLLPQALHPRLNTYGFELASAPFNQALYTSLKSHTTHMELIKYYLARKLLLS